MTTYHTTDLLQNFRDAVQPTCVNHYANDKLIGDYETTVTSWLLRCMKPNQILFRCERCNRITVGHKLQVQCIECDPTAVDKSRRPINKRGGRPRKIVPITNYPLMIIPQPQTVTNITCSETQLVLY